MPSLDTPNMRAAPLLAPFAAGAAAHLVPSVLALQSVRSSIAPTMCGTGRADHIALTFDDGPDPRTTPHVLEVLAAFGVRATFFVLGGRAERHPDLVRRAVQEGHEIAVHGWTHGCHLLRSPVRTCVDIARAARYVHELSGAAPQFFRPSHGIPSGTALLAAHRAGMRTVFWTVAGHDWGRMVGPSDVMTRLRSVHGGETVLLHDAISSGEPRTREVTVPALVVLLPAWRARGLTVGPLSEHGIAGDPVVGRRAA